MLSKQRFDLLHRFNGETDAAAEDSAQFREHDFADEQFMFGEDMTEHVSGEAAGGEGADEDVRVKKYPHDTTRATSSSVRYPRASAKGAVRRRSSSNRIRLSWLCKASRTTSLRVRPVRRHRASRLVGKWKISQNRALRDQLGVISGLSETRDVKAHQMARAVQDRQRREG